MSLDLAVSEHLTADLFAEVNQSILLVAGEASGDQHAAHVTSEIKKLAPGVDVFGMGGSDLRKAGMRTVVDSEKSASVMGLTEVLGSVFKIRRAYLTLLDEIEKRNPKVAILVDFPDFNLVLARRLHERGIKILYFISPQLWAWRKGRVKQMKKLVTRVLPIFPFETEFYQEHGVPAEFVGHPFLDREAVKGTKEQFYDIYGLSVDRPTLAILPGSRKSEVERLLPVLCESFVKLKEKHPDLQAILPVAPTLSKEMLAQMIGESSGITLIEGRAREVLYFSDAGVVASGTATVEAALAGLPFVVVYKMSALSYFLGKLLVRGVKQFAMANLISGKKIVEELLQDEVNSERVAIEIERLFSDNGRRQEIKREFGLLSNRLRATHGKPVGTRVAELALETMRTA